MYKSTIFTVLSAFLLSVPVAPLPLENPDKRGYNYGTTTYFYPGLGACGWQNSNSDAIVAISVGLYGSGGNCGQWISVTNTANGNTAYAMVADKCMGCAEYNLDLSPAVFDQLGSESQGVLSVEWEFI